MVDDLSSLRGQVQISVHSLIKKRSDARCSQAQRLGSKIHSLTNSTCLEMHVAISTVAVAAGCTLKIADHRECYTSVTRQVLSQTESCRYNALVSFLDFFQLCVLRPVAVNTRLQAVDAVDVKIQLDERSGSEIGEETSLCGCEKSCKLRKRDRFLPTPEVKSRTPVTNDIAEAKTCGEIRRQADFTAPGWLRLGNRRRW